MSSDIAPEDARRTFTDRDGLSWTVREERIAVAEWSTADFESSQHGYGVGWLLFEREGDREGVRKGLRLYPANWHGASDRALETLCGRARRE